MTLQIQLSPLEEAGLREQAARQGLTTDEYVQQMLKQQLGRSSTQDRLATLGALLEDDENEQRETGTYLLRVLDEDRLSDRKLFS